MILNLLKTALFEGELGTQAITTQYGQLWQPTPVFFPGKSHGQRSLAATIHGVTKSLTQLSY